MFFLPESTDDLDREAGTLANVIDSQYVVTYTPRRPVKGSPPEEVRQVRVSSRRPGVRAEAYRKLRPPLRQ